MSQPTGIIAFSPSTPASPTGYKNTNWQTDNSFPFQHFSAQYDTPYKVIYAQPGAPAFGATIYLIAFDETVTFPANFGALANSSGAQAGLSANPTATFTYTFKKSSSGTVTTIGTLTISTAGAFTWATTGGAAQSFVVGDILLVSVGTNDPTLLDVTINLPGYRT